jgi:hypothetical protein
MFRIISSVRYSGGKKRVFYLATSVPSPGFSVSVSRSSSDRFQRQQQKWERRSDVSESPITFSPCRSINLLGRGNSLLSAEPQIGARSPDARNVR